jgi:hypothetical protein
MVNEHKTVDKRPHKNTPGTVFARRPSENEAATSGNVALPIHKTMASSTRLTCATEAKYLCHNAFDGQSVGTLILARLVAQRLTPCNYDIKGYAALGH